MRSLFGRLTLLGTLTLPAWLSAQQGGNAVTAANLRTDLRFIASDETYGRATPSFGLDITAQFIVARLARLGLRPAGDSGSWFQRLRLRRNRIDSSATWIEFGGQRFLYGVDFVVNVFPGTYAGPIVYVGHGWVIKSRNIDAYAGLDVRGKIVVVAETGIPGGLTRADLVGPQGEDWEPPPMALRKRGAKAMMMVPSYVPLLEWQSRARSGTEGGITFVEGNQPGGPVAIPVIRPSLRMFQALFRGEQAPGSLLFNSAAAGSPAPPFAISSAKQLTMQVSVRTDSPRTQNVIGVLEGSDATLKNEYVVVSAHYDHLGVGAAVNGDSIYNGADDDGSGTAAMMAIAEAFAGGPRPKRSVLFIWHTGEEQNRWGSKYFVEHPTVPLSRVVAALNMDMIGRTRTSGTDTTKWTTVRPGEIYVIGSKRMSTELGDIAAAVNRSYLRLSFNYRFDAPDDPSQLFLRSDHYSYHEKGIPVIFFYGGEHEDFHQPSDSFDKIDYQNLEKVARTVYATALELANRERRPRLDGRN